MEELLHPTPAAEPDLISTYDTSGRMLFASQSVLDVLGKTMDEVVGRTFHELDLPRDLADRAHRQIQEVVARRQAVKDENSFTGAAGPRQYDYTFIPVLGRDGRLNSVACVARDITQRRLVQRALRESEERFRQFAENSADVFWIADAQTRRLEYLNPVTETLWGESRASFLDDGTKWLEMVHPDDREHASEAFPRVLKGEVCTILYRIIRPSDEEIRWIRDTGFPIRNEAGEIYRVAGVARDITEEFNRTEALAESEERFRLLVEGTHEYAIFLIDPGNRIVYWSAGAERVFGWTAEEALGETADFIFTAEDRAKKEEERELQVALREGVANVRRWKLRKDGTRLWIEAVTHRLNDENGHLRGFAKIARDASDDRRYQDELRRAREELEERVAERTRDLLAINKELERTMAQRQQLERELLEISEREKRRIGEDLHDMVCQELTATALFLKVSAKKVAAESPAAAATLEESAQIVNRNVGLTRDLARGLQPAELTGSSLREALRALGSYAAESSSIKCQFKVARGVRVTDDNIALHLYRVAQEAVNNAIKHSGAKNLIITLDKNARNICVTVEDDGVGFSPRPRAKGLGLHIMRYRANALGGEIKITRRKPRGMQITCVIPVKR